MPWFAGFLVRGPTVRRFFGTRTHGPQAFGIFQQNQATSTACGPWVRVPKAKPSNINSLRTTGPST